MKYSSAAQLNLEYEGHTASEEIGGLGSIGSRTTATDAAHSPSSIAYDPAYAANARIAGRINAASISEHEHEALLKERAHLLNKKFEDTATRQELNRLEYVRWSLDRVEDAKYGHVLEALDDAVTRYENVLAELKKLEGKLGERLPRSKRRPHG